VGRVPSDFGDHGDLVYLVTSNWLTFIRWALWEASSDLLAEFSEKEGRVGERMGMADE